MSNASSLFFPPFQLDVSNEQLWREDETIPLRRKTFAVLRYLVEHAGQLVTKDQLLDTLWAGTAVVDTMPTLCIRELRKALDDDARRPQFIETVHGRGYRFIASITTPPNPSLESRVQSLESEEHEEVLSVQTLDPRHQTLDIPLVGRETELVQLHRWLEKALNGERQIIFVTGEPGIGKTSLVASFLAEVGAVPRDRPTAGQPQGVVRMQDPWITQGQCIEQHGAGEAFLPMLDALGRLGRGPHGGKLIEILRRHAPMWLVQMPPLLETVEYEALQRQVQGASRGRMLREITEVLEQLAAVQPVILVLEDLHWSDVSTLDLLAFLARRQEPARLLVIGTYRPVEMLSDGHPLKDITQELYGHRLGAELPLGLLSEGAITQYLEERFAVGAQHAAPLQTLTRMLHHRTGGNPLFLVSLVNDLIERKTFVHSAAGWELRENAVAIESTVPDTIRHLVARQSGRLSPEERHTLEAASVAGAEFSAAAVAAALATDTAAIEQQCEQLAERQQFLKRLGVEEWPDGTLAARYSFLHALYQQLWHERVSPTHIQHFHLQIGRRKERAYGERVREIAAELAVHFEQGREFRKAVQYLRLAGENALRRSAHQEAITLLTRGLETLKMLPDSSKRAQQELGLQLALGPAFIATKGNGALEVEHSYRRAQALCRQVGESQQLFPALFGLRSYHIVQAELQTAHTFGQQLFDLAHRTQDADFLLEARLALGGTSMQLGAQTEARAYYAQGLAYYDPVHCDAHASLYGTDPGVLCCSCLSWILQWLGYPDQALRKDQEAICLAQQLDHPFSLAVALNNSCVFYGHRQELQTMRRQAEALLALATAQGFPAYAAVGAILQGVALAEQGHREEGIAQAHQGLAAQRTAGAELPRPFMLILLADTCVRIGQVEEGLQVLDEVQALVNKSGACVHEAELYRLKGELTLQQENQKSKGKGQKAKISNPQHPTPGAQSEAEECFHKAIDIARRQQTKMWELRATTSLARLWQSQGKQHAAHDQLSEIYRWFTEGFDTVDLKEAKALLKELSERVNNR